MSGSLAPYGPGWITTIPGKRWHLAADWGGQRTFCGRTLKRPTLSAAYTNVMYTLVCQSCQRVFRARHWVILAPVIP